MEFIKSAWKGFVCLFSTAHLLAFMHCSPLIVFLSFPMLFLYLIQWLIFTPLAVFLSYILNNNFIYPWFQQPEIYFRPQPISLHYQLLPLFWLMSSRELKPCPQTASFSVPLQKGTDTLFTQSQNLVIILDSPHVNSSIYNQFTILVNSIV